jgi:hypothetical protein
MAAVTPPQPARLPPVRLFEAANKKSFVEFVFPPEKIKVSHSSDTKSVKKAMGVPDKQEPGSAPTPTASAPVFISTDGNPVTVDPGDTILSFSELILDGGSTLTYARRLVRWTHPASDGPKGTPMDVPLLTFTWGSFSLGDPYDPLCLVLTKVDVEYTRFTSDGIATRASVSLGCKVKVPAPAKQNPTSGGDPDRSGRRMIAGENLQGVARERYGDPRRWRQIADVNGVDDPLRVRPGDVLYLPGPAELGRPAR